ncbi:class I SAM-dependent methyltransferase [Undibacterium oligocarboniphilum]|uniref:Class I SAM-dependent methyltransferase n=1 Tax=Undibacterium oligocarboniphilum TaxID=666702 RepID=A0A850QEJ3_9BURK|nr:class I SAM-dependent methyltransferase [Undibacterium oligocarboniphilum]MBC3871384.1 class I SAM-dependent methyltransferase [Undibacterium oligocarboniphilum]NVO78882.1 class I SAM-dependent methyltransferase [Undibacterium oligocarboniphilum]
MNSVKSVEKDIIDLDSWLELPPGQYIRNWEQAFLATLTVDIFGFNALQIGMPQIDALAASRMPHRWYTNPVLTGSNSEANQRIAVVHEFTELPFDAQSIDLVVLPHVLEFAVEPHQILREVERVLIPEGRVIITGFNRASLWGLRQFAGRINQNYYLPREGEFISSPRLKDWLKLLNMEIAGVDFGCYAPSCHTEKWLQRFQFMENAGRQWWTPLGAVYVIQAVKRVRGMHLIGLAWKQQRLTRAHVVPLVNKMKK